MIARKRTKLPAKLLLLFGVTALLLCAAEVGARLFLDLPLAYMQDRSGNYVPFLAPDEELGRSGHRNFEGALVAAEFRNEIVTNSLGFRSPDDYGVKREGIYRILVLGDSFTFGIGVEQHETYAALLEKQLKRQFGERVESLNLGVIGYGTLRELKILERHQDLAPDLVILGFYARDTFGSAGGNDLVDNYYFSNRQKRASGEKVVGGSRQGARSLPRQVRSYLKKHSQLYRLFESSVGGILRTRYKPQDNELRKAEAWRVTVEALRGLDEKLDEIGAKGLLLWIPYLRAVAAQDTAVREKLESLELRNVEIVSLLAPMKDGPMQYYYRLDSHWNSRGHEVAADALLRAIVDGQLIRQ